MNTVQVNVMNHERITEYKRNNFVFSSIILFMLWIDNVFFFRLIWYYYYT